MLLTHPCLVVAGKAGRVTFYSVLEMVLFCLEGWGPIWHASLIRNGGEQQKDTQGALSMKDTAMHLHQVAK